MKIKISSQKRNSINKGMMGLFFEDINYAADGGLYAEMLENRNFNFVKAAGDWADYYVIPAGDYGWKQLNDDGSFNIVSGSSLSTANPFYARLQADKPGFGISNKAYEGITVKEGESYNLVIWARPVKSTGSIKVCLKDGAETIGETIIPYGSFIDEKYNFWKLYSASIKADKSMRKGKFELSLDTPGVLELAYVSLIPGDAAIVVSQLELANGIVCESSLVVEEVKHSRVAPKIVDETVNHDVRYRRQLFLRPFCDYFGLLRRVIVDKLNLHVTNKTMVAKPLAGTFEIRIFVKLNKGVDVSLETASKTRP